MTVFGDLLSEPLRNGLTRPKSQRGTGIPMVNMGELFAHRRITDGLAMDLVPVSLREKQFLLAQGDLLFARQSLVREGAGKCAYFAGRNRPTTFESHLIRARIDPNKGDPRYWSYYFNSGPGRAVMQTIVEQVAAAGIRGSDLARLPIEGPDVVTERRITFLLEALASRINLNQYLVHDTKRRTAAL